MVQRDVAQQSAADTVRVFVVGGEKIDAYPGQTWANETECWPPGGERTWNGAAHNRSATHAEHERTMTHLLIAFPKGSIGAVWLPRNSRPPLAVRGMHKDVKNSNRVGVIHRNHLSVCLA